MLENSRKETFKDERAIMKQIWELTKEQKKSINNPSA